MAIFNSKQLVYQRVGGLSEVAGCWPHSEPREECDADEGTALLHFVAMISHRVMVIYD